MPASFVASSLPLTRSLDGTPRSGLVDLRLSRWRRRMRVRLKSGPLALLAITLIAACAAGLPALRREIRPALIGSPQSSLVEAPAFDARFVGRWVSADGKRILIARSGAIWADSDLLGQATLDENDGIRLSFSGDGFRCDYTVTFAGRDETSWHLTAQTPGKACPSGRFARPFTF